VSFVSAQTSFHLAPWGNRQFELLVTKIGQAKAGISLKEGTFSEGFFDLVIYANSVDSQTNKLEKVFIYDERSGDIPLTIIAKKGQILQDPNALGNSALLRLESGDIHRKSENHTKIKFDSFDIRLFDDIQEQQREKTPMSMTIEEISNMASDAKQSPEVIRSYLTEFHKRWALAVICPIFALLGVGLSTQANRRQKSNGLILSLGLVLGYWILYVAMEGFARGGQLPVIFAVWLPNTIYTLSGVYVLKKNWN
jgi:lipopolysaccharide export system permease protein